MDSAPVGKEMIFAESIEMVELQYKLFRVERNADHRFGNWRLFSGVHLCHAVPIRETRETRETQR